MFKKVLLVAALSASALAVSLPAMSVEPKTDRAVVTHLNAHLLLPDESTINVDMSLNCGSKYEQMGMMITSDQGAQLMAVAYAAIWGQNAGQKILDTWNNKVSKGDPRKPTFIVVSPPDDVNYWSKYTKAGAKKSLSRSLMLAPSSTDNVPPPNTPPPFFGVCGTISHDDPLN